MIVSEEVRAVVERICAESGGVARAAARLELSRDSVLRVLARQSVRRGTVALLERALEKRGGSEKE